MINDPTIGYECCLAAAWPLITAGVGLCCSKHEHESIIQGGLHENCPGLPRTGHLLNAILFRTYMYLSPYPHSRSCITCSRASVVGLPRRVYTRAKGRSWFIGAPEKRIWPSCTLLFQSKRFLRKRRPFTTARAVNHSKHEAKYPNITLGTGRARRALSCPCAHRRSRGAGIGQYRKWKVDCGWIGGRVRDTHPAYRLAVLSSNATPAVLRCAYLASSQSAHHSSGHRLGLLMSIRESEWLMTTSRVIFVRLFKALLNRLLQV